MYGGSFANRIEIGAAPARKSRPRSRASVGRSPTHPGPTESVQSNPGICFQGFAAKTFIFSRRRSARASFLASAAIPTPASSEKAPQTLATSHISSGG